MSDDAFSKFKIGWLSDMNGHYEFEAGIIDMCEKVLHGLETTKVQVEHLKSQISPTNLWDSWTTLRAKNIFDELSEINLVNQVNLGFPVQWEYQKGEKIKFDDTERALWVAKKKMYGSGGKAF
ncbi:MAG: hypothetical protein Ct9H300mP4_00250 [Gammaproteobacteria bacterium]|nr:MAG: hypothetical protein Ct9H300mP4_00250 [Gammaproteobacteria bacterium]